MSTKIITALIAAPSLYLLPAIANMEVYQYPHLWILTLVAILASYYQPTYKPLDGSAPDHDRGTATQLVWTVYLTQAAGVIEATYFRAPESFLFDQVSIIALCCIALGFGIRTWAVMELGKFFTWHITVQEGQRVVQTGPYSLMRHPSYTGGFLIYFCTIIFLHAWVTAIFTGALLIFAFLRRIRYEEEWLIKHLGSEYQDYSKRVKSLIPYFI